MKKKNFLKKGLSLMLAGALTIGLCACGGGGGNQDGGNDGGKGNKGGKNNNTQTSQEAKQNVYRVSEVDFHVDNTNGGYDVFDSTMYNDRLYFLLDIYGENGEEYKLVTMEKDGSNLQEVTMEMPDAPGYHYWGDDGEIGLYGVKELTEEDGQESLGEEGEEKEGAEDTEAEDKIVAVPDIGMPMMPAGVEGSESTNYYNFQFTIGGEIIGIENHNKDYTTETGEYQYENDTYVCRWGLDGALLQQQPVKDYVGENGWINGFFDIGGGDLMLRLSDENGENYRVVLGADGQVKKNEKVSNDTYWDSISNYIATPDGKGGYVIFYDENDNWRNKIVKYEAETDSFGEAVNLPDMISTSGYNEVAVGIDSDLIFSRTGSIYKYNLGDAELTEFMNCVNSDIATYSINRIVPIDEDHFAGFYYEYATDHNVGGIFTRVAPEDVPDKKTLVLGVNWTNLEVTNRVVQFNKKSNEYRIAVRDYSQYNTNDDYTAGVSRLNNDIITGNMPDIIMLTSEMPVESYVSKGLLADIDKLIAEDAELGQKEFLQNVFDAYRYDGKLYSVISSFVVNTFAAKTSIVGDRSSWTMDEFLQVVNSLPEGTSVFGATYTRDQFLWNMMNFCGNDFVDVSTGKCEFDSDNFIKMLEFAATMQKQVPEDFYEDNSYWENYESQYRDNRTLLMSFYMSSADNITYNMNGYFGEDVSFVGFPTDSGKGSVVSMAGQQFAISAKSGNIDGAWQFVRYYLTDEYQNNLDYQIPVEKKAFDAWAARGMQKPYWTDEKGEKHEYEQTFYMNGESIEIPVLTQAQVDKVKAFITSIDKASYYNEDVSNIIAEEAEAFFSGQKSAKEVADIIQSRVKMYVNTNM